MVTSQEEFEKFSQSLLPKETPYYDNNDDELIPTQPVSGSVGGPQISVAPSEDSLPQADSRSSSPDDGPSIQHPSDNGNPPLPKVAGVRFNLP